MGYTPMAEGEWLEFLRAPVRPAVLATVRRDGRPHAAPIWFDLDGGTLVFTTGATTVKGWAIRRDPRVTLCVQDDQPPFSFVMVEGEATTSDDLEELFGWAARIGGRYMGADQADTYGRRNAVPGELLVRVRPTNVVAVRDVAL